MSTPQLPGGRSDSVLGILLRASDFGSNAISVVGKVQFLADLGSVTADVANIRAGYDDADDTVRERSAQILQQQFLISDMAGIVHDALLPESVGLFQDAISIVNTLALALAAERQSLTVTQALPPTAPLALSGALTLFGSLASTVPDMELQDKLSFPGDSIFSGALAGC